MKTKDGHKKSLSRSVPDQTLAARFTLQAGKAAAGSSTSGLLYLSIRKSGEQSENVYENKGQGQEVEGLRSRGVAKRKDQESAANVALGPLGGRWWDLLGFSTAQLFDCKTGEQSENVYEKKGRGKKVDGPSAVLGIETPGKPKQCAKYKKSWERTQGVLENKGHHFFECCKFHAS